MRSIHHKILLLCGIVLFAMGLIWGLFVHYNQQVLEQYNGILQRYLRMNEASERSQRAVAALNEYMLAPDGEKRRNLDRAVRDLRDARDGMAGLLNEENGFLLANHMHLMDSLDDAIRRTVMFGGMDDGEEAAAFFEQATRVAGYISETTLSLIGLELSAYDAFYRGIMEQSREIRKLGFLVLGLVLMMLLAFAWWFSRGITRPIQQLTAAARELSRGRFDRPIDVRSSDEIAFLARTIDRMRISINDLFQEIRQKAQLEAELAESRLLLRESQLRSLQNQINPHFLFNTLDTLAKKAFLEGAEETSDLIASVAALMRYNLRRIDRSVTLREEADMVAQYVEIQKTRFADRLDFRMELDPAALDVRMPCLTLQPLVENAVIHAVEPREEGGIVRFTARCEEDGTVRVAVEDDGPGIPAETAVRLLEGNEPAAGSRSTGIGLTNVVRRLRLYYGKPDVIAIESPPAGGTRVTLLLPRDAVREAMRETPRDAAAPGGTVPDGGKAATDGGPPQEEKAAKSSPPHAGHAAGGRHAGCGGEAG